MDFANSPWRQRSAAQRSAAHYHAPMSPSVDGAPPRDMWSTALITHSPRELTLRRLPRAGATLASTSAVLYLSRSSLMPPLIHAVSFG
jgi:hypothetical protein